MSPFCGFVFFFKQKTAYEMGLPIAGADHEIDGVGPTPERGAKASLPPINGAAGGESAGTNDAGAPFKGVAAKYPEYVSRVFEESSGSCSVASHVYQKPTFSTQVVSRKWPPYASVPKSPSAVRPSGYKRPRWTPRLFSGRLGNMSEWASPRTSRVLVSGAAPGLTAG